MLLNKTKNTTKNNKSSLKLDLSWFGFFKFPEKDKKVSENKLTIKV